MSLFSRRKGLWRKSGSVASSRESDDALTLPMPALDASRAWSIIGGHMKTKLIHADPSVMMGKPVIAGTRITVELILEKLAAGETVEQLLEAHPRLTRRAVLAALAYAAS